MTDAKNDLPEQVRIRREKRERLLAAGRDPYPVEVPRTISIEELVSVRRPIPSFPSPVE